MKFILNKILLLALLLSAAMPGFSQNTKVFGKVVDANTKEPLPFVNVVFKGTQIGTTTDMDGRFLIETSQRVDSLLASFVGYTQQVKPVARFKAQTVNFELSPSSVELQEIVIKPGENPAHPILRNIIANKKNHNKERLDYYQYEAYNKVEFDINNIDEELRDKKIFKHFSFIFDNIDTTNGEKPYLPMFMTESLSDVYYRKKPKTEREYIKAVKVSGIKNESINQFMGDMYQSVNIYDDHILVFGKAFFSPISDHALHYYKFYLVDSAFIGNDWSYKMTFMPRRRQEPTFAGEFWVADTSFALKSIDVSIASDANINFIKSFSARQEFEEVDSMWMLTKDKLIVDFNIADKAMGIYGRKTTSYRNFILNTPAHDSIYKGTENVIVSETANEKPEEFWTESRHDSLSKNEMAIYTMIDSIKEVPQFRTVVDFITIVMTGYKVIGKVELGPYFTTYSFNQAEGSRFRFGGRTSNEFSTRLMIDGHVAYGLKDEIFKYSGGFQYFLKKKPRMLTGLSYKYDVEQLGQSPNALRQDNILASAFRRNPLNKLTLVEQYRGFLEREWITGFSNRITLTQRTLAPHPLGSLRYEYYSSEGVLQTLRDIKTSEISLLTRFAYKEKYVEGQFERISLGTKYPTLQALYTVGLKGVLNSDYEYQKLNLSLSGFYRTKPFGYMDYLFEAGKIWGRLPYPLLELHSGNETYSYDFYAFNMMNYFEFASDQYFSASLTQHFNGFFLNKIPLLRRLKWREVALAKGVIGSLSRENREELILPEGMSDLSTPYLEAGVGLENILRIFRTDILWRITHLDKPNVNRIGFRATFQINF